MKHFVIANPAAGRGRAAKQIAAVREKLAEFGLDYELVETNHRWHATVLAREAALNGYDVVITASGDGTTNEALNGLMQAREVRQHNTALGMIPLGTGNDLAGSLGIPQELHAAVQAIKEHRRTRMDIGRILGEGLPEPRYFGNCVGMGFDAAGTILSSKITYVTGMLAYLIAAVQTIFTYHASAPTVEIKTDSQTITQKSLMVSIMNGKRIGGGFQTAPDARANDGLFDLCIAQAVPQARMFTLIPHFIKGTAATQPEIQMTRAKRVTIRAVQGSMPVQTDGEVLFERGMELTIEMLPLQLDVLGANLES